MCTLFCLRNSRARGYAITYGLIKILSQNHCAIRQVPACADLQAVHGGIAEKGAAGQAVQNVHARKGRAHKEEQQPQCDAQPQACVDGDEEAAQECGQPHEAVHLADLSHAQAPVTCVFQWRVGAAF